MKRSAALLAFALAVSVAVLAQEPPATPATPVVELPKFVVKDTRELPPPESWRYATIPGFELLTNASDKATQRLLRDFDMFRQALAQVWPLPNRATRPAFLIICGRGNKFDAFIPEGKIVPDAGMASLFLKQGEQAAIVIDFQATTLNVLNIDGADDAATGTDSGTIQIEHDKQLYREYVRYLLSRNEPRMPAWFEEGLSQIIMKMEFDRRWIQFAKLEDPNTVSTQAAMIADLNATSAAAGEGADAMALPGAPAEDRDFPAALRRRALVPLDRFFAIKHDSSEATNVLGNNVWAKQAYAFVHMCLYGEHGKYQKPFMKFLQRAQREPVTEEMFKECFRFSKGKGKDGTETFREMSYKDMLMAIRSYCDFTVYEAKEYRAKEDVIIPPPPLALREATQSEIGRIKGEALILAGHTKAAHTELSAPYIRGERDPELLASLGLYERKYGEEERARKFLEAAYTSKAKRPEALLELARFRFADATAKPAGTDGHFSEAQVKNIVAPLLVARQQPPHLPALYELVGDTWLRADAKPRREDAQVVIDGAILFPTRLKLVYEGAVIASEAGELKPAHALTDHGIKYAPDANVKKRFEDLKASLPPAPAEPAASASPASSAAAKTAPAAAEK
jgi:hypothetical protein